VAHFIGYGLLTAIYDRNTIAYTND
jgi:hypothetical protein